MDLEKLQRAARSIRLFALDLDGTLLNSGRELAPRTRAVLRELLRRGYLVVPTTGRSLAFSANLYPELREAQYAISTNGALVTDLTAGETLFYTSFSGETARRLTAELLAEEGNMVYVNTLSFLRTAYRDEACIPDFTRVHKPFGLEPDTAAALGQWLAENRDPVLQMGVDFARLDGFARYEAMALRYPELEHFRVGPTGMEFVARGTSKCAALGRLCKVLELTPAQVCAVGDNGNDAAMLRFAGIGVAMGNAIQPVRDCADYVTLDNDHDGAAVFLERFFLRP